MQIPPRCDPPHLQLASKSLQSPRLAISTQLARSISSHPLGARSCQWIPGTEPAALEPPARDVWQMEVFWCCRGGGILGNFGLGNWDDDGWLGDDTVGTAVKNHLQLCFFPLSCIHLKGFSRLIYLAGGFYGSFTNHFRHRLWSLELCWSPSILWNFQANSETNKETMLVTHNNWYFVDDVHGITSKYWLGKICVSLWHNDR